MDDLDVAADFAGARALSRPAAVVELMPITRDAQCADTLYHQHASDGPARACAGASRRPTGTLARERM